jgi:hypothetical protein
LYDAFVAYLSFAQVNSDITCKLFEQIALKVLAIQLQHHIDSTLEIKAERHGFCAYGF